MTISVQCVVDTSQANFLVDMCESVLKRVEFPHAKATCFALREAVINAVAAAKKNVANQKTMLILDIGASAEEVELRLSDQAEGISIDIIDKMAEIDPKAVLYKENGRGLMLIQSLMDEVWCEQNSIGGITMVMKKRRGATT